MRCDACGSDVASVLRWNSEDGWRCNMCGQVPITSSKDAYFRAPYFEQHFADDKHPHGQFVESKEHKAQIMRTLGIREGGDLRHGSRSTLR